jgi:hypothetical protein
VAFLVGTFGAVFSSLLGGAARVSVRRCWRLGVRAIEPVDTRAPRTWFCSCSFVPCSAFRLPRRRSTFIGALHLPDAKLVLIVFNSAGLGRAVQESVTMVALASPYSLHGSLENIKLI